MDTTGIIIITIFVFNVIVFLISLIPWIHLLFIWLRDIIDDLIDKLKKGENDYVKRNYD